MTWPHWLTHRWIVRTRFTLAGADIGSVDVYEERHCAVCEERSYRHVCHVEARG